MIAAGLVFTTSLWAAEDAVSRLPESSAQPPALSAGSLDCLWVRPVTGDRRRASSWDKTGGNHDCCRLEPGERVGLLEHQGSSGSIRRIWFTLSTDAPDYLATAKFRFTFDDHVTIDDVPVGMLAATGPWRVNDLASPVINIMRSRPGNREAPGTGCGSFNLLWPMPFARRALVELLNDSTNKLQIHYYIDYLLHPVEPQPLWLHATWKRAHFTTPARQRHTTTNAAANHVFADITNHTGRYVGTILAVESHPARPGKWHEGDDLFVIDGRPRLHGTGTEDYFGMAWGFHRPYQGYDHGLTHYERNLTANDRYFDGRFVAYRWHLCDPIPFQHSLHASIEAGHNNDSEQHYESVAFWFGRPLLHATPRPQP